MNSPPPESGPSITPRVVAVAIARRKIVFIAVFLMACLAAVYVARKFQFKYQTSFRMLARPGVRERYDPGQASLQGGRPFGDFSSSQALVADAAQILQSRDLIQRLADGLVEDGFLTEFVNKMMKGGASKKAKDGGEEDGLRLAVNWLKRLVYPPEFEAESEISVEDQAKEFLVASLLRSVEIRPVFGTTVIEATISWDDPLFAHEVARRLVEVSQAFYRDTYAHHDEVERRSKVVKETKTRLEKNREGQANLLLENKVSDFESAIAQRETQISALQELNQTCQNIDAMNRGQLDTLNKKLAKVKDTLPGRSRRIVNPQSTSRQTFLFDLQMALYGESRIRGEESQIEKQIKRVTKELAETPEFIEISDPASTNPVYTTIMSRLVELESNSEGTNRRCDRIQMQIQDLELELNKLVRMRKARVDLRSKEEQLDAILARETALLRVARVAQSEMNSLQIFEQPRANMAPLKNRRPLILLGGILGGLAAAAFACLLLYRLRSEFSTSEDLRKATGMRVVTAIPNCTWLNLTILRSRGGRGQP